MDFRMLSFKKTYDNILKGFSLKIAINHESVRALSAFSTPPTEMTMKNEAIVTAIAHKSIRIPVLALGKGWLAVDKPPGMTVHNEAGRDLCSIASAFIHEEPALQGQIAMDPGFGLHPVHRLDRETSGILLLAAKREVFRFFSKQFECRRARKHYLALLHGRLEMEGNEESGTWGWPLAKTAGGRHDPQGAEPRQASRTRYRVLGHSAHYTLVEIELLSGRTHQIRRHAKLSGHPVVGDSRYGSKRAISYLRQTHGFDRLALHAHRLTLRLPDRQKPKVLETHALPAPIRDLFVNDSRYASQNDTAGSLCCST